MSLDRREFCKRLGRSAAVMAAAASFTRAPARANPIPAASGLIPKRRLGRNGLMASTLAIGGGSRFFQDEFLSDKDREEYLGYCLDQGVNYVDTARTYGNSEEMLGDMLTVNDWDRFILSTKTNSNSYDGVMEDFKTSQRRLKRDHFDVYLLHNSALGSSPADNEDAFSALQDLREAGDVANIGLSCHGPTRPETVLEFVKEFDLDHCILTVGHTRDDYRHIIPELAAMGCTAAAFKVTRHVEGEGPASTARETYRDVLERPFSSAIIAHANAGGGVTWKDVLEENLATARAYGKE